MPLFFFFFLHLLLFKKRLFVSSPQVQVMVSKGHRSQDVRLRHPPLHLPQLYHHRPGETRHTAPQHGNTHTLVLLWPSLSNLKSLRTLSRRDCALFRSLFHPNFVYVENKPPTLSPTRDVNHPARRSFGAVYIWSRRAAVHCPGSSLGAVVRQSAVLGVFMLAVFILCFYSATVLFVFSSLCNSFLLVRGQNESDGLTGH